MSSADFSVNDVMFRRTSEDECRIVVFGETVGSVMKRQDVAKPDGGWYHAAHLWDDPRGPVLIDDRDAVRDTIAAMLIDRDLVPSTTPPARPEFSRHQHRAA
ncbi:MAG: hypothetical protein OXK82_07510 [Deltaproteobacteria bacterium]|nr:hypothetical protein [Deltaproteobacteria bacterium]